MSFSHIAQASFRVKKPPRNTNSLGLTTSIKPHTPFTSSATVPPPGSTNVRSTIGHPTTTTQFFSELLGTQNNTGALQPGWKLHSVRFALWWRRGDKLWALHGPPTRQEPPRLAQEAPLPHSSLSFSARHFQHMPRRQCVGQTAANHVCSLPFKRVCEEPDHLPIIPRAVTHGDGPIPGGRSASDRHR